MNDKNHVLIAGAGPVGLVAANVLADAGVPVTVFEAESQLPQTLRGSTFHPPTLDMLSRLGVSEPLIDMGLIAPKLQYRDRAGWVATFDLGLIADLTDHPFRVQCEQHKLTTILAERLRRFPHAAIEFSASVVGVDNGAHGASIKIKSPDGVRAAAGAWLIGADGGRSRVREAVDIPLVGFTWPERFLVASTAFDFASAIPDLCDVTYVADAEEWYFLLRVPALWRVMFPVREYEKDEVVLSDEDIERRLQRVCARPGRYEVAHKTLYAVHQRIAQNYRRDRVFLAGDAAHLNNPLGGMGMNGGIHDAFNLAEKLARVVRGEAPESELDRYERQRRPIALEYVNTISTSNKRNLEARDPQEQRRWRDEMTRTANDPVLAREYLSRISMFTSLRDAALVG
jgi:3-(3-hydroxy-phenyl)propionate hydroxylase